MTTPKSTVTPVCSNCQFYNPVSGHCKKNTFEVREITERSTHTITFDELQLPPDFGCIRFEPILLGSDNESVIAEGI